MRDEHVLDRVVVEHRPVGLRVIDGGERAVDGGIVGDGDGETHHHRPAHVAVHHLQQLGHRRALRLEVLDVPVGIVEETSGRILRRDGSSGEGEDQQRRPHETCVCVSHGGRTVGPPRALALEINERLIEGAAPRHFEGWLESGKCERLRQEHRHLTSRVRVRRAVVSVSASSRDALVQPAARSSPRTSRHTDVVETPVQGGGAYAEPCSDLSRKTDIWARFTGRVRTVLPSPRSRR